MELSSQEGEIPMPITSTFGGGHGHGHGHVIHHDPPPAPHSYIMSSSANQNPSNAAPVQTSMDDHGAYKKVSNISYRECLKNHAATMGGNATDGCGEFMPSGEEGTIEALTCSACNCHRNFHRKEIYGEPSPDFCHHNSHPNRVGRKFIFGHHHHKNMLAHEALGYPTGNIVPSRTIVPPHQMILPYNMGSLPSESDEQDNGGGNGGGFVARPIQLVKKRYRTKFTQEQKEKMLNFAEKIGWKIQKQEESVLQQFCQEIGVKRRVLKVWMHNNKHNLAKKNSSTS